MLIPKPKAVDGDGAGECAEDRNVFGGLGRWCLLLSAGC